MVPCLQQTERNVARIGITAVLSLVAACGSPINVTPDAPADADVDAPQSSGTGLSLAFRMTPPVPGTVFPGVTLDSVELSIKDLRLTGDAAPGDDRTRAAYLAIAWRQDHQPFPATFPQAPAGLYSKIAFKLENDSGDAFRMRGTVMWDGSPHAYEISDDGNMSVDVPMSVVLPAGGSVTDTLQVRMLGVMAGIDWSKAKVSDDGTWTLRDNTLNELRSRLALAFTAASVSHGPPASN
jgi:hypothetical protein